MYNVSFMRGTEAGYAAIGSKSNDTLYFCTDSGNLYLGSTLFTGKVSFTKPETGVVGVLYISGNRAFVWNGSAYVALALENTTAIDSANAADTKVPTEKAVVEYVRGAISEVATSETISNIQTNITNITADVEAIEGEQTTMKGNITDLQNNKADKATTLEGYGISDAYTMTQTDTQIDNKIKTALTSALVYRGTVQTFAELPTENLKVGDTYNVATADPANGIKAGDNVAWNGTGWDVLAGTVDLSSYETAAQTAEKIATAKTEAINAAAQDATTKADAALAAAKEDAASKDATNLQTAKDYADAQDATNLQAAKAHSDANLATAKTYAEEKASAAETAANAYADGLAKNYDASGSAAQALVDAKSYADGLAGNYDAAGAASTAETNAKAYADGLAGNYDAAGSATAAETAAKAYTDTALTWGSF